MADGLSDYTHQLIWLRNGRRLWVPRRPGGAIRSSFDLYHPQGLLGQGARLIAVSQLLLARKALVYGPQSPASVLRSGCERVIDRHLVSHLEDVVRRRVAHIAVYVGPAGPQQKAVVLMLAPDGAKIAYAKVGWQDEARRLVQHEAHTLSRLRAERLRRAEIPEILHCGEHRGLSLLVTAPLAFMPLRSPLGRRHVEFLEELGSIKQQHWAFRSSPFRRLLEKRVAALRVYFPEELALTLDATLPLMDHGLKGTKIPFTSSMGDFVPWNLGHDPQSGRLIVVDLENFSDQRLIGWDLFHFLTMGGRRTYDGWYRADEPTWELVVRFFSSMGVDLVLVPFLMVAYLLDIWTQRAEAHVLASGGLSRRVLAAVDRGLRLVSRAGERARTLSPSKARWSGAAEEAAFPL